MRLWHLMNFAACFHLEKPLDAVLKKVFIAEFQLCKLMGHLKERKWV